MFTIKLLTALLFFKGNNMKDAYRVAIALGIAMLIMFVYFKAKQNRTERALKGVALNICSYIKDPKKCDNVKLKDMYYDVLTLEDDSESDDF